MYKYLKAPFRYEDIFSSNIYVLKFTIDFSNKYKCFWIGATRRDEGKNIEYCTLRL